MSRVVDFVQKAAMPDISSEISKIGQKTKNFIKLEN